MYEDLRSITHAGAILLTFSFLAIVFYFTISTPLEAVFDGFDDINDPVSGDEMDLFLPNIRTALNIAFAIFLATPATGFIFWVFSKQPIYERYRRY